MNVAERNPWCIVLWCPELRRHEHDATADSLVGSAIRLIHDTIPDAAGSDGRVTSIGTGRPSVVVERHSVADPGPRDHVASIDCWCDPTVEVVHRVAPAPSTIPDHRVIDLRTRGEL